MSKMITANQREDRNRCSVSFFSPPVLIKAERHIKTAGEATLLLTDVMMSGDTIYRALK